MYDLPAHAVAVGICYAVAIGSIAVVPSYGKIGSIWIRISKAL